MKPWNPRQQDGPAFWYEARFDARNVTIASGEWSKDSGYHRALGSYAILSGDGTRATPYVLRIRIDKLENSNSVGYEQNFGFGPVVPARAFLEGDRLHLSVPEFGTHELRRERPAARSSRGGEHR